MKVFVTGGSGFVGGALIRDLAGRGCTVVALARSDAAARQVLAAGAAAVVRGDLADRAILLDALIGCDAVVHSAAVMKFHGREEEMQAVNVDGTRLLLATAREAGVARFVAIGAAATLSDGRPVHAADERYRPVGPLLGAYARSKAEAERAVLAANRPGFETMVVIPPAVWGAGDPFFLPMLLKGVRRGQLLWISGGRYPFSLCHIGNVCAGVGCALERGRGGERYLIADSAPSPSFREAVSDLLATQGLRPPDRSLPRWLLMAMLGCLEWFYALLRPGQIAPVSRASLAIIAGEFTLDDSKARREIGYCAPVSRAQGLRELRLLSEQTSPHFTEKAP